MGSGIEFRIGSTMSRVRCSGEAPPSLFTYGCSERIDISKSFVSVICDEISALVC